MGCNQRDFYYAMMSELEKPQALFLRLRATDCTVNWTGLQPSVWRKVLNPLQSTEACSVFAKITILQNRSNPDCAEPYD